MERTALLVLLLFGVVVALAVAAAPAIADTSTTLQVTAEKPVVDWNSTLVLEGILMTSTDPPEAIDQQQVRVEYSSTALDDSWLLAETVTNEAAPSSSGEYTCDRRATFSYYWRMYYPGVAGHWSPAYSTVVQVGVRPLVGKPHCPSSVAPGKKFRVWGSLKPRFPAGSKTAALRIYKYVKGEWRIFRRYTLTNANPGTYSTYWARVAIAKRGAYRFEAHTHPGTDYAAATSARSRTLRVR